MIPEKLTAVVLEYNPCSIIVARPLKELWYHVKNRELPSLELIIRSIKAVALAIFKWHFCDRVALTSQDRNRILHSIHGKFEELETSDFNKKYTFMSMTGFKLVYNSSMKDSHKLEKKHPSREEKIPDSHDFVKVADFKDYKEITPQTICEYFRNFHGIKLTSNEKGNTISDLFKSKYLISKEFI